MSGAKPNDPNAAAEYNGTPNEIQLGSFSYTNDIYDRAGALNIIAHELFHAYEALISGKIDSNTPPYGNVSGELDANLFAGFVEKQLDAIEPNQTYYNSGAGLFVHAQNYSQVFGDNWDLAIL